MLVSNKENSMDIVIGGIQKGANKKVIFKISEYKGKRGLDIREHFKCGEEWKPTQKGTRINIDSIASVVSLVEKAEDEINNPTTTGV
jgi:hypothetical protein